ITEESKKGMRSVLDDIESGEFKTEWRKEWKNGLKEMKKMEKSESESQIEVVGREIRSLFEKKKQ
ncbi:MAG: ketol-acid reductoisomerase, partial [Candidatus Methanomethylophilaceae archaeon]